MHTFVVIIRMVVQITLSWYIHTYILYVFIYMWKRILIKYDKLSYRFVLFLSAMGAPNILYNNILVPAVRVFDDAVQQTLQAVVHYQACGVRERRAFEPKYRRIHSYLVCVRVVKEEGLVKLRCKTRCRIYTYMVFIWWHTIIPGNIYIWEGEYQRAASHPSLSATPDTMPHTLI